MLRRIASEVVTNQRQGWHVRSDKDTSRPRHLNGQMWPQLSLKCLFTFGSDFPVRLASILSRQYQDPKGCCFAASLQSNHGWPRFCHFEEIRRLQSRPIQRSLRSNGSLDGMPQSSRLLVALASMVTGKVGYISKELREKLIGDHTCQWNCLWAKLG